MNRIEDRVNVRTVGSQVQTTVVVGLILYYRPPTLRGGGFDTYTATPTPCLKRLQNEDKGLQRGKRKQTDKKS